jgi:hypothetical protein
MEVLLASLIALAPSAGAMSAFVTGHAVVSVAATVFMLSAPAINPVVLVATVVAFSGQPAMVLSRCVASLVTAVTMGLLLLRWGRSEWVTRRLPTRHDTDASRWTVFTEAARQDFLRCHHLLKTFYTGVGGWGERQLPDGTLDLPDRAHLHHPPRQQAALPDTLRSDRHPVAARTRTVRRTVRCSRRR